MRRQPVVISTSLAVVAALGMSACGGGDGGGGGSKTVRVTLANHVWTDNIKKALPEFEKQSGLKVEITQLGEDQLSDQYNVKLNAGSSDIDVMMYRPLQEGKLFAKNGYLADLTVVLLLSNDLATPTTRKIRIALDGQPFPYRAGQAAGIGRHGDPATPYSIASAPSDTDRDGYLEFLIKVDGSNRFGALVSALEPGIRLDVTPAGGRFGIPDAAYGRPLLFIAGGTGIAPLRSMIREYLHRSQEPRPALVYSARTPEEFAYGDELRALADAGKLDLTLTLTGDAQDWRHARGRTGDRHLAALATPKTVCFICGPPSMVTDVPEALTRLGIPRNQIVTEDW